MPAPAPYSSTQALKQGEAAIRLAGWLAVGSGVSFFGTVTYLFTVLPATGWSIDMFDAPAQLLTWVDGHPRIYQLLWLLYFLSQACLLAVPTLIATLGRRWAAPFGTTSVVLAMAGLATLFAVSPVLAHAYRAANTPGSDLAAAQVLVLHDVTADAGKDLRLFSELLLGVWLNSTGLLLAKLTHRRLWWTLSGVGAWTVVVAAIKLFDPTIALEDWLGFLLGVGYLLLGVGLLRLKPYAAPVTPTDRSDPSEAIG